MKEAMYRRAHAIGFHIYENQTETKVIYGGRSRSVAAEQEGGKRDDQELLRGTEMSGLMTVMMVSPGASLG